MSYVSTWTDSSGEKSKSGLGLETMFESLNTCQKLLFHLNTSFRVWILFWVIKILF